MNNLNVERAPVDSRSSSPPFPIFDIVIWGIAVGLLVLMVAVNG